MLSVTANRIKQGLRTCLWVKCAVFAAAVLSFPYLSSVEAFSQSNQASPVGTNLEGVTYYTTEQPFLNVFKVGGNWVTRYADGAGGFATTGEESLLYSNFLDTNGYPTT